MFANDGGLSMWWARQDSNLQPDRYERLALTLEQFLEGSAQVSEWLTADRVSSAVRSELAKLLRKTAVVS
jgi:hypothetical protein